MRMVKIENERNNTFIMETHSRRRDEVSPTIIASKKILGFVILSL